MELARLFPAWTAGVVLAPQEWVQATRPAGLVRALAGLLHRAVPVDFFGTDYPGRPRRVQLTWVLWGYPRGRRYLVQSAVAAGSATLGAGRPGLAWFEREVWEMFGVRFEGHPDLRRLLTDYGFGGFPLLKDFPVTGHFEVRFSERTKRVTARGVQFLQEFRTWDFQSPWSG